MILVSHLLPAGFTQQIVQALHEADLLDRFCTTLTPSGRDPLAAALRALGVGGQRAVTAVPTSFVHTYPWREALRLALGRLAPDPRRDDSLFHWARDGFDRWVARQLTPSIGAVYAYETECLETFRAARDVGAARFYDLPSPEHEFVEDLLQAEFERFPELNTADRAHIRTQQAERTVRRREEFALADLALANSQFTRDTWVRAGLPADRIAVVPLGAPEPDPAGSDGGSGGRGPLRLLWVGTFSVRKGAHYLLEAVRHLAVDTVVQLDVFGSVALPTRLLARLPAFVQLHGPVPQARVLEQYRRADALLFPTLCDGFGLVVNEALSRGLPVITTNRAGASDLIAPGRNGLVIEAGSADAIREAIAWCCDHREELRAMRPAALASARHWQWSDYRRRLIEVIKPVHTRATPAVR